MGSEHGAHISGSLDDVEDACGKAGFRVDFGQLEGVQGSEFGGLVDHAVAGGEAGGGLPEGDLDGVVPGSDSGADSKRCLGGVEPGVRAELGGLAVEAARGDHVCVVLEDICAGDNVGGAGLGEGLSSVSGLNFGELVIAFAQQGDCS